MRVSFRNTWFRFNLAAALVLSISSFAHRAHAQGTWTKAAANGGCVGLGLWQLKSMISPIVLSCVSSRRSSSVNLAASALCEASVSRRRTKARTTKTLISIARGEFNTVAAIMAPYSVKA